MIGWAAGEYHEPSVAGCKRVIACPKYFTETALAAEHQLRKPSIYHRCHSCFLAHLGLASSGLH